MHFTETKLSGVYIIDLERLEDERGFFARSWCIEEFLKLGLDANLVQCNISHNIRQGTLRGMHYQIAPHEEAKVVRCTTGAVYDVVLDLRIDSPTCKEWVAVELTAQNRRALYVPPGIAHGFQTLKDDSEVFYQMSEFYHQNSARGVRWNDPAFAIEWPDEERILSKKDAEYGDFCR